MAFIDLIIVALVAVIAIMVIQNRRNTASPDMPSDPEAQRLAAEVTELRARIHVLERAITDNHGSSDLADEIDRLRDR